MLLTTWLSNIAFHLSPIWLQILVVIDSESRLTLFQAFACRHWKFHCCLIWIWADALFLGQVVDLDLLLCTGFNLEHAGLCPCHIFTQRPMTDRKIEQSYGRCFGRQQLLANSIEIFISYEKKGRSPIALARTTSNQLPRNLFMNSRSCQHQRKSIREHKHYHKGIQCFLCWLMRHQDTDWLHTMNCTLWVPAIRNCVPARTQLRPGQSFFCAGLWGIKTQIDCTQWIAPCGFQRLEIVFQLAHSLGQARA